MAKFKATVVPLGDHHSPDGVVRATPQRVAHWCRTFRELARAGVRVPVCWGHSGAEPVDEDEFQLSMARHNAGYVTGMTADPDTGALVVEADCPGVAVDAQGRLQHWYRVDGRELQGAIGETSVGLRDWTDGRGRLWRDAPIHVAWQVLPVVHGQRGFASFDNPVLRSDAGPTTRLSTLTFTGGSSAMSFCDDLFDDLDSPEERLVKQYEARQWRQGVRRRLLSLCRRGLSVSAASGVWMSVRGRRGAIALSTDTGVRQRVEAKLDDWEQEFTARSDGRGTLPLTRDQRESVDLLTGARTLVLPRRRGGRC